MAPKVELRRLSSPEDFAQAFALIQQLRTHLSFEKFSELLQHAVEHDGYRLDAIFEGTECVAVMGCRVLYDFVHGKHLYVDDLVVAKDERSRGFGPQLLRHAEKLAREQNCTGLRLCTGLENEGARRFYEREGWTARALAYKKKLLPIDVN